MINLIKNKTFLIDILQTIILPVIAGVCFIIWVIYLFQYPVIVFPAILIILFLVYFISGYLFGGIFLAFIISFGLFTLAVASNTYFKIFLICEIAWISFTFYKLEYHRNEWVNSKNRLQVEHEVLDRDIALIQSSIVENEKRISDLLQRMNNFQTFGQIISSLESSLNEHELIKLIEGLTGKFIGKGIWKTKIHSRKDVFVEYVKTNKVPLIITDTSTDKRFPGTNYKGITSVIVMPVEVEGSYWGSIKGVSYNKNVIFDDSDLRLLSVISTILGTILYNSMLFQKISELAITDDLTGLYTKTYFKERLQEEIEQARSNNLSIIVAMIDIDHFKKVNDTYGHLAGDMLLRQISDILRRRFREIDILARYGGEEFSILIPHINMNDAFQIFEGVRKLIENEKFFLPVESYHPIQIKKTISIGLAELNEEMTADKLIKNADLALYDAKHTGRNKTCIYKETLNEKN